MRTASRLFVVAVLIGVIAAACSVNLRVVLFNNTAERVTIKSAASDIPIDEGRSGEFAYPQEEQNWVLRLATTACDYAYSVPKTLDHYPWSANSSGGIKAQLERDFSIYLLPPTADAILSVDRLGPLQEDGFPLRPVSKACR